jgi:hypothetical protein
MKDFAIKITSTDEDKAVCALMNQFDWGYDSHVPYDFPYYRTANMVYFSGAKPAGYTIISGCGILPFFIKHQWEDKSVEQDPTLRQAPDIAPLCSEWENISFDIDIGKGLSSGVYLKNSSIIGFISTQELSEIIRYLSENFPQFFPAPKPDPELMQELEDIKEGFNALRWTHIGNLDENLKYWMNKLDALLAKGGE